MEGHVPYNDSNISEFVRCTLIFSYTNWRWCLNNRSQSAVWRRWRGIHHLECCASTFDDARPWILLRRPGPQKIRFIFDPCLCYGVLCHFVPMVLLGIQCIILIQNESNFQLAFSTTSTHAFIGNLDNFGLMNVLGKPSPASIRIPELLYAQFQSQFAAVAIGILLGCVAERARIFPTIIFTFIWLTLVYCPMVCLFSTKV